VALVDCNLYMSAVIQALSLHFGYEINVYDVDAAVRRLAVLRFRRRRRR
jgi:hypothetical protein